MSSRDEKDDFNKGLSIGVLDIETTGFNADYCYCFCVCIYDPINNKMHTFRIDDPKNPDKESDRWVVKEAIKCMNSFDLIVGWYSSRFDIPFLNSRALKFRLNPPVRNFRRDLCFNARGSLKLRNNKLFTVGQFLFGQSGKTVINPKIWNDAIRGKRPALNYVVKHCELDVIETAKIYRRMLPLIGRRLRRGG